VQILLVDDSPLELFLSLKILQIEYKAEGFKTLAEAIDWAKVNTFDLLISDYYIDDRVSAGDVLKAIVDLKGKTFKCFVLTNYIDPTKVTDLMNVGFDGILSKPLTLEKFKEVVEGTK
jgi:DNA-binding NarL/FixJ family response regulator